MISTASGHGRRRALTSAAQTRVWGAKVIDRADQIHALLQGECAARQCPTAARQRRQALTERRVESLDVRRVDDPVALRAAPEGLDACRRASHNAALDLDQMPLGLALHDLGDTEMAPGA
jgi:hypothetical protein